MEWLGILRVMLPPSFPHILPILVMYDSDQLRGHGMEMTDEEERLWMINEVEEVSQRNYVRLCYKKVVFGDPLGP